MNDAASIKSKEIEKLALATIESLYSNFFSSGQGLSHRQWQLNRLTYGANLLDIEKKELPVI